MNDFLAPYHSLLGPEAIEQLEQTAQPLKGIKIVHVNSVREGGGVAEILNKMVPFTNALGIQTEWKVITGDKTFFECTKLFHNLVQGKGRHLPDQHLLESYEKTNARNAEEMRKLLEEADIVFIHDPQPLPLITHFPKRKGKWIWRCHIDASSTSREVWKYLRSYVEKYDASIFSLEDFVHPLPHPVYLIRPSIDPLSEKNIELDRSEVEKIYAQYNLDINLPTLLQVSRFDRFKDPLGVVRAFSLAKKFSPSLQLILAGEEALDDPEGAQVLEQVRLHVQGDPSIHLLFLPHVPRVINALQRGADIVLQKSIREGFGLTITEALWKSKPVIGGNTGGIRLQVVNHYTGFLVNTPEGAALSIRYLLQNPEMAEKFGEQGRKLVKENFLITRHLREYLTVIASLLFPRGDRIYLQP